MTAPQAALSAAGSARSATQRICALLLILVVLGAGALLVRMTLGYISAVPALRIMQQWEYEKYRTVEEEEAGAPATDASPEQALPASPFVLDGEEWDVALQSLQRAIRLSPDNPELHANLGRLYQYRFDDNALPLESLHHDANRARDAFRQAAYLRPTWSYHWWDLARTEYRLQRTHTEDFARALNNTVRFGPWLEDVQLFATDLGLEHWDSLDAGSRQIALGNIDRGLQRNPEIVLDIVATYDAWASLCEQAEASARPLVELPAYCADPALRTPALLGPGTPL